MLETENAVEFLSSNVSRVFYLPNKNVFVEVRGPVTDNDAREISASEIWRAYGVPQWACMAIQLNPGCWESIDLTRHGGSRSPLNESAA